MRIILTSEFKVEIKCNNFSKINSGYIKAACNVLFHFC